MGEAPSTPTPLPAAAPYSLPDLDFAPPMAWAAGWEAENDGTRLPAPAPAPETAAEAHAEAEAEAARLRAPPRRKQVPGQRGWPPSEPSQDRGQGVVESPRELDDPARDEAQLWAPSAEMGLAASHDADHRYADATARRHTHPYELEHQAAYDANYYRRMDEPEYRPATELDHLPPYDREHVAAREYQYNADEGRTVPFPRLAIHVPTDESPRSRAAAAAADDDDDDPFESFSSMYHATDHPVDSPQSPNAAPPQLSDSAVTFPQLSPTRPLVTRLHLRSRVFFHRMRRASSSPPGFSGPKLPPPTFTKTYPARTKLPVRIYIPPPDAAQPGGLPLYIHVAPTTFLGAEGSAAAATEHFCRRLAHKHGICVASVTFRAPPRWLFPTQVYDVVALVEDIMAGSSLPFDRRRVALGGFGAGASVALSVVQTREMRGLLRGVVALGPVVDWTIAAKDKLDSVDWQADSANCGGGAVAEDAPRSKAVEERRRLEHLNVKTHDLMYWSYVPAKQDLTEPLLSPAYAPRAAMPRHVFLVAAQHDMLCAEVEKMATRLAADAEGVRVGDDDAWDRGGIKWERVRGRQHGFAFRAEKGERETERRRVTEDLFDRIADWLWAKVYA